MMTNNLAVPSGDPVVHNLHTSCVYDKRQLRARLGHSTAIGMLGIKYILAVDIYMSYS